MKIKNWFSPKREEYVLTKTEPAKKSADEVQKILEEISPHPMKNSGLCFDEKLAFIEYQRDNGVVNLEIPVDMHEVEIKEKYLKIDKACDYIFEKIRAFHCDKEVTLRVVYESLWHHYVYVLRVDEKDVEISYHKNLGGVEKAVNDYLSTVVKTIDGMITITPDGYCKVGNVDLRLFLEAHENKIIKIKIED